jgi:hypothetical protein
MRAATVVELVVVLLVMGLVSGIGALAIWSLQSPASNSWREAFARARVTAIQEGRAVSIQDDSGRSVLLLPDGRAIGPGLDQLTGEVLPASR